MLACLSLWPVATSAQATRPIGDFWVADSTVLSLAEANGTVYAGGYFSTVGPYTGGFVVSDPVTGVVDVTMPRVAGTVSVIASDGAGGWYLAGAFTSVGGVARNHLAHVLADGRVSAWNPNPDTYVYAIAKYGNSVYLGGSFTTVGGTPRSHAAAVDAATGAVLPWNPNVTGASSSVNSIVVSSSYVYLGGRYTLVNGTTSRNGLARVDLLNGTVDAAWNPAITGFALYALALPPAGNTIYLGGQFTVAGGQNRNNVAQLNTSGSATATAWDPNPDGTVNVLLASGSLVYVGGFYYNIGNGTPALRNGIAAVAATGAGVVDPTFNPSAGGLGVNDLSLANGLLYVAGSFTNMGGQLRRGVAALDPTTGAASGWSTNTNSSVSAVRAGPYAVAIGGSFWSAGVLERAHLAAFDAATGAATAWNPGADSRPYSLDVATAGIPGDEVIYAGGQFTTVGGQPRNFLAALDAAGNVTSWNPNLDGSVWSVKVAGDKVLAGGAFTGRIGAFDTSSGLNSWTYGADNDVETVSVLGSSVYAGGWFNHAGGGTRDFIAKLDLATGAADLTWNANCSGNFLTAVGAIVPTASTLYVSGRFTSIGGAARAAFAALDPTTAAAQAWDPKAFGGTQSESVGGAMVFNGGDLVLAGDYYWLGGLGVANRQWLGSVSVAGAVPTPWYVAPTNDILGMAIDTKRLFVGGEFDQIASQNRKYLAAFCLQAAPTGLVVIGTGANQVSLSWTGSAPGYDVYRSRTAGGPYELVGSSAAPSFTDTTVEGGVTYFYVVRAVNECESDPSNEVSATPTGLCGLPPDFEGVASGTPQGVSCWLTLRWAAATDACGGGVTYDVYRSTSPTFTPSGSTRIATGLAGTSYVDQAALTGGATYYYIVRATSTLTGEEDDNLIRLAQTFGSCSTWPAPVAYLGVTSTDGKNQIEWVNPAVGPYTTTRIRYNTVTGTTACTFPTSTTGTLLVEQATGGIGGRDSFTHGSPVPLPNDDTTYCYAAFTIGGTLASVARTAEGRPFNTPTEVKWAYSTGASAVSPPGIGWTLFAASNDRILHGLDRGPSGGTWPVPPWSPLSMSGPAQERPPVLPGPPQVVLLGSQDGYVYAASGDTGAELWRSSIRLGDVVQAAPAAILSAYGGVYDYVLIGTRNSASDNVFYALNKDTGTVAATFDNGGGTNGIGIISGAASVDYATKRVFFASRARAGGSSDTLWCLQIGSGSLTKVWSVPIGDIDGSPIVRGGVVYVGNNLGEIHAVWASDGSPAWATPLPVGAPVKGFLFPNRSGNDLFFSTFDKVWRINDDGASGSVLWSYQLGVGVTPSIPLFVSATNHLYVGGSDGQLYELDVAQTPPLGVKSTLLGDGSGVIGAPTYDNVEALVYVGSDAGLYYAVSTPLP